MEFLDFSDEVLFGILLFVDSARDLCAFAQVSKQCCDIAKDKRLWKNMWVNHNKGKVFVVENVSPKTAVQEDYHYLLCTHQRGSFTTVQEALSECDKIKSKMVSVYIRPGKHTDTRPRIKHTGSNQTLNLIGEGQTPQDTILHFGLEWCSSGSGLVQNLSFRTTSCSCALLIKGGCPTINKCEVTESLSGVHITKHATSVTISDSYIHHNNMENLRMDNGFAFVSDCHLSFCGGTNVVVSGFAHVTLCGNTIHGSRHGICSLSTTTVKLSQNSIFNTEFTCVELYGKATVEQCEVFGGQNLGVFINGEATLSKCTIRDHRSRCIWIGTDAKATMEHCTIFNERGAGVLLSGLSKVKHCKIGPCLYTAFDIEIFVKPNTPVKQSTVDPVVSAILLDLSAFKNFISVEHNVVHGGVTVKNAPFIEFTQNEVFAPNTNTSLLQLCERSSGNFVQNHLHDTNHSGVYIHNDGSRGIFYDNHIHHTGGPAFDDHSTDSRLSNNLVHDTNLRSFG